MNMCCGLKCRRVLRCYKISFKKHGKKTAGALPLKNILYVPLQKSLLPECELKSISAPVSCMKSQCLVEQVPGGIPPDVI